MVTLEDVVEVLASAIYQLAPEEDDSTGAAIEKETELSAPEAERYFGLLEHALQDHLVTARHAEALRHVIRTWECADTIIKCLSRQLVDVLRTIYGP